MLFVFIKIIFIKDAGTGKKFGQQKKIIPSAEALVHYAKRFFQLSAWDGQQ